MLNMTGKKYVEQIVKLRNCDKTPSNLNIQKKTVKNSQMLIVRNYVKCQSQIKIQF